MNWEINFEFQDVGESSETLERPELRKLLNHVRDGEVDCLVVYSVDRLTRKLHDLHKVLAFLEEFDVRLCVVTDPHFGETPESRLMTNIVAAASEFMLDLTRDRMTEARTVLKRKGLRIAGRVPQGYTVDPETKQLIICSEEAERIRIIFSLAEQEKRPQEIADEINKRGWTTKRGGNWTARQILKIISNPTYAGLIRNGDETLPGQHAAIVSEETFERVREIVESRRTRTPGRSKKYDYWYLRGKLKCARCGRIMSPTTSGRGNIRHRYYRCRSTAGGKPPCGISLPAHEMEKAIWEEINIREEDLDEDLARFYQHWDNLESNEQWKLIPIVVDEIIYDRDAERMRMRFFGNVDLSQLLDELERPKN